MKEGPELHLCTVCLERNRWGSRRASFRVSEWLARFAADGFDGIELWENHYLDAGEAERERLAASAAPVAVYSSYAGLEDAAAEARARASDAARNLRACAVKFNLGPEAERLQEYRRNLLAWSEELPASCRWLCECHPGTVLEHASAAAEFLEGLDPARFGAIVHVGGGAGQAGDWFAALGPRACHLHVQLRTAESDPGVAANRRRLDDGFAVVRAHGFDGSAAIEFTRGIGRDERIEQLYANALADGAYCREQLMAGRSGDRRTC